jgi:hypothetical protein
MLWSPASSNEACALVVLFSPIRPRHSSPSDLPTSPPLDPTHLARAPSDISCSLPDASSTLLLYQRYLSTSELHYLCRVHPPLSNYSTPELPAPLHLTARICICSFTACSSSQISQPRTCSVSAPSLASSAQHRPCPYFSTFAIPINVIGDARPGPHTRPSLTESSGPSLFSGAFP